MDFAPIGLVPGSHRPHRRSFRTASYHAGWQGAADRVLRGGRLSDVSGVAWRDFLKAGLDGGVLETIRSGERTGRPLGDAAFVARLEAAAGRDLARRQPGPKPAARVAPNDQGSLI
jgi:putative transposase